MGNKMRAEYGDDVIVQKALEHIETDGVRLAVVESIRAIAEAQTLKSRGAVLLAVDADLQTRYERVQQRRSEKDQVSYETFVAQEELEKNDPDPHGMQKAKVMEMADYTIFNNETREVLHQYVDEFLAHYGI
jgi:dephospho-CoA kinase